MGTLQLVYTTPCILQLISDPNKWPSNTKVTQPVVTLDGDRFWRPQILVRNAFENQGMDKPFKLIYGFNHFLKAMLINYGGTFHVYW